MDQCTKRVHAHGLCSTHYKRFRVHGDPNHVQHTSLRGSFEERFWAQVTKRTDTEGACWEFTRARDAQSPYGRLLGPSGRYELAHRASWELHCGPIPEGIAVLHRCDNPPCVRPEHLFLGDWADNNHDRDQKGRGYWQGQTSCPNGHAYDVDNTFTYRGKRQCVACRRARYARSNARRTPSARSTDGR